MKILLSIKVKFVNELFKGIKRHEYRRGRDGDGLQQSLNHRIGYDCRMRDPICPF